MTLRIAVPTDLYPLTTRAEEADPRDAGMSPAAVDRICTALEGLYQTGLYPGISLCLRREGQVVVHRSIGHKSNPPGGLGPGALVRPDTPFCIFSASKAVTAMLVHHLDDKGLLHVGDRVAEYIPEFGRHGKEWVTIRHVLSHRAGIPSIGDEKNLDLLFDWDGIVARLCDATPVSAPGRRLAYHAITGGFILGEVIRRVCGKDIRQVLREEVCEPLGFEHFNYGYPVDRLDDVVKNAFTGRKVRFPISAIVKNALGVSASEAVEVSNGEAYLGNIVPSGNIVGTADELCRFYEMMRNGGELDGVRVFAPRTIHRACAETSYFELDATLALPVRYGEGLMLGTRFFSPFGPRTQNAFGHLGFINIHAWADPDRAVSCALLTSGKPIVGNHLWAIWKLLSAISKGCPPVQR